MALLTTAEFAVKCGVSTTTVRRWNKEGKVAGVRTPGGHLRFDTDVILNAEAAIPPGMAGLTSFLRLQLLREAEASVSLDRDQTHSVGPVESGAHTAKYRPPLRDDDPPHPQDEVGEVRKTLVKTQGQLIEELSREVTALEADKRELLDQLKNSWKVREGYGLIKIHDLLWFQGLMGEQVAHGHMYQHHLDIYSDMVQRNLGLGWAAREHERLERSGTPARRSA